jgi:L-2-hydroxyglutarate oxidase
VHDAVVIGAGLVGLATARALQAAGARDVLVLETADAVAAHQSGRNSGVVHSGLYYKPGSRKAALCVAGREALARFCDEHDVAFERCGKLVVATNEAEVARLDDLQRRGEANGLAGVQRLTAEQLREHEPHAAGLAGLFVPQTGIVDFVGMAQALAGGIEQAGGEVRFRARVLGAREDGGALVVETTRGAVHAKRVIGCAGLYADRVASACGLTPDCRIVPFRGEYHVLAHERRSLVRGLIYPVPDARFPFLGVHFTRRVNGDVEAGPNAVLAFAREGYSWADVSPRDVFETLAWPGFRALAARYAGYGFGEMRRSLDRHAFAEALRRLLPELRDDDLQPARAGVRAQALGRDGALVDDFAFAEGPRQLHVLNAPSPAATASLAIGEWIAARAMT